MVKLDSRSEQIGPQNDRLRSQLALVGSSPAPETNTDLGYGKLFSILLRRRFWILGVSAGVVALTTPLALQEEPTYQSSMQLLVEANYQAPETRDPDLASELVDSSIEIDYATQLSLMRSSELLQRAIDRLESLYPELTIEDLRLALSLTHIEEDEVKTKIFEITFISNDPIETQKVLEAIQAVYLDYNLEQQQARLARGLTFIDDQLPIAREEANKAQQALRAFRQTHNLIDPNQSAETISKALGQLQIDQQELQANLSAIANQVASVQESLGDGLDTSLASARLSQSERYQTLLDDLQATEMKLAVEGLTYRADAPVILVLKEQRQELLALLATEASRVLGNTNIRPQVGEESLRSGQFGNINLDLTQDWLDLKTQERALEGRDRSLALTEERLRQQLDRLPSLINEYDLLKPEVETTQATIEQLLAARQELLVELAQGGFSWQVVEAPQLGEQTGPNLKLSILVNIIAGLFLGTAAAFGRDALDSTLHAAEEIAGRSQLPLLGTFPKGPRKQAPYLFKWSPLLDASDLIYKKIQLAARGRSWRSLLVTSAIAREGKSTAAIALASSAHRMGERVLLIDANLRSPSLHEYLQLPNEKGLTAILTDETFVAEMLPILKTELGYDVLTAGPVLEDPLKLLSSPIFHHLLERAGEAYDRVIIDTTPLLGKVDALQLASLCDGVCLVGRLNRVTEAAIDEAIPLVKSLDVFGMIVNGTKK